MKTRIGTTTLVVGAILLAIMMKFSISLAFAQQGPAVESTSVTISPVTLNGEFVRADKNAGTLDIKIDETTQQVRFEDRIRIKGKRLEDMFSRMKTGDKATFFGYSKPDGTVIINQIRIVRSTNSVSQVGQSRN